MATIADLRVRLSAEIDQFEKEFGKASSVTKSFASDFEGIATRAAAVGTFIGNVAKDMTYALVQGFGQGLRDAVKASGEMQSAMVGLDSIAAAFGHNVGEVRKAAQSLTADGLLPMKDAAAGLKNLLATGFSLDQATTLMNAFKDSAAFGRQGALSFGDAIRAATEGIKNGNSALVDNAGVTKNLSNILQEAGFKASDLGKVQSDLAIRTALYTGILKETNAQTGDAAKYAQTYTGQVSRLDSAYTILLATIGDSITTNATAARLIRAVSDAVIDLTSYLGKNANGFNLVSETIIGFAKAMIGVISAVDLTMRAVNLMDTALKTLVNAFANANLAIVSMVLNVAAIASKLPGGASALGLYREQLVDLVIAQDAFGKLAKSSAADIQANEDRVARWGGTLGTVKASLSTLVTELEATRGKTVELGVASTNTSRDMDGVAGSAKLSAAELKKAAREAEKLKKFWADLFPGVDEGLSSLPGLQMAKPTIPALVVPDFSKWGPAVQEGLTSLPGFQHEVPVLPKIEPTEWEKRLQRLKDDLKDIGLQGAHTFAEGIAEGIETGNWGAVGQAFEDAMGQMMSQSMAAAVNAFIPGLGSALAPIFDAVSKKITSAFDFNEGRDLVEDFAKSFGGFDALQKKLQETFDPATAHRFWVALTQGVGRDNPQQAKAVIEEVTQALAAQKTKQEEAGAAAAAASRAVTEAQEAALSTVQRSIDDLSREYDTLWNSIKNEAPEEVMGIIESQTRARMASVAAERAVQESELAALTAAMRDSLEDVADAAREAADAMTTAFTNIKVPNIQVGVDFNVGRPPNPSLTVPGLAAGGIVRRPTLALVGESGPEAVVPLGQLGAVAAGETTVILELDGRAVAEIAVPHLPGVIRRFVAA